MTLPMYRRDVCRIEARIGVLLREQDGLRERLASYDSVPRTPEVLRVRADLAMGIAGKRGVLRQLYHQLHAFETADEDLPF